MLTTAFLSMWISNTATTSMMVPIVMSLLAELIRFERSGRRIISRNPLPNNVIMTVINDPEPETSQDQRAADNVVISRKTLSKIELNMCKAMMLAICYSASLGGTATLTGTLPNVIMAGLLEDRYGSGHPINYASWMGYNSPGMIINIFCAWCWLQIFFFGPKTFIQCFRKKPPNRPLKGKMFWCTSTDLLSSSPPHQFPSLLLFPMFFSSSSLAPLVFYSSSCPFLRFITRSQKLNLNLLYPG